ncbi:MAG: thiamine pyrophosphate-binding protein, partial [Candidatus Methylomirabilia bacterium]
MTGKEFAELLEGQGYNSFTGVPCSLIESVLRALEDHPRMPYLPAVREDVAVGLAAGAWLSGRRPAVLIQNSGLGTGLNALASLSLLYKLPSLLVVTWRGHRGIDAPEHLLTGAMTQELLRLVGIQHRELSAQSIESDLSWATREAERRMEPVALLLPPRVLEEEGLPESVSALPHPRQFTDGEVGAPVALGVDRLGSRGDAPPPAPELSRMEALCTVVSCLGVEPVIHANGYVCRES